MKESRWTQNGPRTGMDRGHKMSPNPLVLFTSAAPLQIKGSKKALFAQLRLKDSHPVLINDPEVSAFARWWAQMSKT